MIARDRVSLGILAGGRGSRLGGVDKAFVEAGGTPLLERTLHAIGEGFAEVLVSHNRPADPRRLSFERRGIRFVADALAAGEGPLAGLQALLQAATSEWLLTLPVDLARPSADLADALLATEGAILQDADGLQPLVALWPVAAARTAAQAALRGGRRAARDLGAGLGLAVVDISPGRLGNLNTPDDFEAIA